MADAESCQCQLWWGPLWWPTYSGAMSARWLAVLLAAAAFIVMPLLMSARPAAPSDMTAVELAARVQQSADVPWSGFVETAGTLQVPDNESFATLAQMLGENTQLRVWWRSADDWRVDRIRSTGETGLFRHGWGIVRWVFESQTATYSPVSKIRLPDASDLLPPTFARSLLQGAREELGRLPARRIAGIDAPGVRLTPDEKATTIGHVDIWADPASGLALEVELYGVGEQRPVLTTTLHELKLGAPPTTTTHFRLAEGVRVSYEQSVDVAAAANAFAPYDLPASLAGLSSRNGEDPAAVGIYGRGPTTLIALPLRGQVAGALRRQLQDRGTAQLTEVGTLAPVGPVGLLITPRGRGVAFLLAGTVTAETLQRGRPSCWSGNDQHRGDNGHVIRTHGLTKRYGELRAVDAVDLDVRAGDVYGFLGANGSGKTTTVRMLLGLVLPTSGEAEVSGMPMPTARRTVLPRIGSLVESPAAYPHLSATANLACSTPRDPTAVAVRRVGPRSWTPWSRLDSTRPIADRSARIPKACVSGLGWRSADAPSSAVDLGRADQWPRSARCPGDPATALGTQRSRDIDLPLQPPARRDRADVYARRCAASREADTPGKAGQPASTDRPGRRPHAGHRPVHHLAGGSCGID